MEKKTQPGQVALFRSDSHSDRLGEIIETSESTLKLRELLKPEDLKGNIYKEGRHLFCGDRELYRTNKYLEVNCKAILSTSPICTLSNYHTSKGFLIRQTYDELTQFLHPDLPKVCLCKENLNPDLSFFICSSCSGIYHHSCVGGDVCPDCKLPAKRLSQELDSPSKLPNTLSAPGRQDSVLPLDVEKYKGLAGHIRENLKESVRSIHMNYLAIQSSLSNDEKTRQQIICKIKCALLLAFEETKTTENFEIHLAAIETLAISVEAAVYFSTGKNAKNPEYSKKIRSILFNLTAEKNPDFRGGILKGEIDPRDICRMQSKDMASSEIKSFRQERQKVYTKEHLILPESSKKLVLKTRKGEAVISVNEKFESDEFNSDILDRVSSKRENAKADVDDDPFNPDNYESSGAVEDSVNQLAEIIREWTPAVMMNKIKDKLSQHLPVQQASRILAKINGLKLNKDN